MRKDKKKHTRLIITIILVLLIIIGGVFAVYLYEEYNKTGMEKIFEKVEETNAELTEYIIYGTHLNLKRRNKR